ncbi:hypothetical protein MK852_09925 [Shewanella benthica]|uniref:hypothetical protein n=1 Tax=Shewanella benthica TaxID=43661 RepID=UPI001879A710|nr:hypothetical protein [Shewanella benthica]MBE7215545.1 hypothetical protein [Shewanella benthica]MCL1062455.1 hypothetical protein [Shewanella benthica]
MLSYQSKSSPLLPTLSLLIGSLGLVGCDNESSESDLNELDDVTFTSAEMQSCFDASRIHQNWQNIIDVTSLRCGDEQVDTIEGIEQLYALETLEIFRTIATTFDLRQNSELKNLHLLFNENLTELNLSDNSKLEMITLEYNGIESLNISQLSNLKQVYLSNSPIEEINLDSSFNILGILVAKGNLTSLDVSELTNLQSLLVYDNQLTNLDLSQNYNLEMINVSDNNLTEIDLQFNVELQTVMATGNLLETINFSHNGKLEKVDIQDNPLSTDTLLYLQNLDWIADLKY